MYVQASVAGALSRDRIFNRVSPATYALQAVVNFHRCFQLPFGYHLVCMPLLSRIVIGGWLGASSNANMVHDLMLMASISQSAHATSNFEQLSSVRF